MPPRKPGIPAGPAKGDGTTAGAPTVERTYSKPGVYSEVLKITDGDGRIDYDFANVHIIRGKVPQTLAQVGADKICYLTVLACILGLPS